MTRLRSLLFVPGNKASMLEKAMTVAPDVIVPDLEDSVPDAEKANARATVADFLPRLVAGRALVVPRVNSPATTWCEADLEAVVRPGTYGVSVGKIREPGDIATISNRIGQLERAAGLDAGRVKLIPWIETAEAIVHLHAICTASDRIVAAAFGAEDFAHDMAIERGDDDAALAYARSALCVAARAAGIIALETPYFAFRDLAGLAAGCRAARRLGFKGRFAIHPGQIETIESSFAPSTAEIEQARRIVAAFEEAEARGRASTSLDGRVVDVPVVKRARALLAEAGADAARSSAAS